MYTITLNDGTVIENLTLNGTNYISDEIIDDSVFEGNLGVVTISDGEKTETYTDMILLGNLILDNQSHFALGEKTEQQKKEEALLKEIAELRTALNVLLTGNEA